MKINEQNFLKLLMKGYTQWEVKEAVRVAQLVIEQALATNAIDVDTLTIGEMKSMVSTLLCSDAGELVWGYVHTNEAPACDHTDLTKS